MGTFSKACGLLLCALLGLAGRATAQPAGTPAVAAAGVSVRGRVTDAQTKDAVGQAEVVLIGTPYRGYTEDDGTFVIDRVPPGAYTISVIRMGYTPFRRDLTVPEGGMSRLDLQLAQSAVKLEEITVTPGTFSFMGQGTGTRQTMSREDVQAVPQIGDDIFRAVNRLPGLASNDYAAHFGIRGGRHDETLILLDGLQIFEPYHIKDFNEGAISIIDAETIDGVQLMTGGFPAKYGDKRSGVFDITSRTPESDRTRIDVGASFMNTNIMARGPFLNEKGSWLAFGRFGYMGLVFQFIDQADLPKPYYEDVFGKLQYQLTPNHALSLSVLSAGDKYEYDIAATTGFNDTINTREFAKNKWWNSYVWGTLKSSLGPRTSVRTILSGGLVNRAREGFERKVGAVDPFYAIFNDRDYTLFNATQDWTVSLSDNNLVSAGVVYRQEHNKDTYKQTTYQDPDDPELPDPGEFPINVNTSVDKSGSRLAFYLSDRWRVLSPLVVEVGARYDQSTWTGDNDVSPRASAAWSLGAHQTVRVGWGYYRQMQGIDDVAALNNATTYYKSELSEQWTAGWERSGAKGSHLRVEGYYKRGSQLRPVFRNWKGAIDVFPEPNEDRIKVIPDKNETKGFEIYYDRPVGEHLTARASYSYAEANEDVIRIENVNVSGTPPFDASHPNPQDQRHAANADLTYRLGPWVLNGSFAYHSGWPATEEQLVPVTAANPNPPPPVVTEQAARPIEIYGARLTDYMRLDTRLTRMWPTRFGQFGTWLEVVNLTNHTNVFGYDYFRQKDALGNTTLEQGEETWFSIFPSLGLTWSVSF